ncbi:hypothetical protein OSB04_027357 [Centaurea solstitialis]|uniref:Reverse transcriptase zinc-binding domain-containing protein n=1 Tax=Centaurea solstitialis TaxID=347529 RepID=A0AA38SQP9_9ASTR|nr:hypothetical protein OSB04_027357 [Centaurea solstitialis]
MSTVADRGDWVNGEWKWTWKWRRDPRGRELGELEDLTARLHGLVPNAEDANKMEWKVDVSGSYSVKSMRDLLGRQESESGVVTKWLKIIPKKVWRVCRINGPCVSDVLGSENGLESDGFVVRKKPCHGIIGARAFSGRIGTLVGRLQRKGQYLYLAFFKEAISTRCTGQINKTVPILSLDCVLCGIGVETLDHNFFTCPISLIPWKKI